MLRLKTWLKWAIILIVVTLAGFWIWAQFFMEDWLRQVVKKEIATLAEKHYNCTFDTLLINTYFFHFELRNLSLTYDRRFAVPQNDPYLVTGKAKLLRMRRFSVIDLVFLRKISMRTFEFDSPQIQIELNPNFVDNDTTAEIDQSANVFNYGIQQFHLSNAVLRVIQDNILIAQSSLHYIDYNLNRQLLDLNNLQLFSLNEEMDSLQIKMPFAKITGFDLSKLIMQQTLKFKECNFEELNLVLPEHLNLAKQFAFLKKKKNPADTLPTETPLKLALGNIKVKRCNVWQGNLNKMWSSSFRNLQYKSGKLFVEELLFDWKEHLSNPFIGQVNLKNLELDSMDVTNLFSEKKMSAGILKITSPQCQLRINPSYIPPIDTILIDSTWLDKIHFPQGEYAIKAIQISQANFEIIDTAGKLSSFAKKADLTIGAMKMDGLDEESLIINDLQIKAAELSLNTGPKSEGLQAEQLIFNIKSFELFPGQSKLLIQKPQIRMQHSNLKWDSANSILDLSNLYADLSEAQLLWSNNKDLAITCPQIQMYQDSGYFENKQSGEKIYCQGGKFKVKKAVFDINAYQEMLVQILQLEMTTQLLKFNNSKTNFSASIQKCINQSSNVYLSNNLKKIEQTRYSSGQWSLGIKNKWLMQGPAVQFFAKDCNQKTQIDGKKSAELGTISSQIPGFQWNQFSKKMQWQLKNISLQSIGSYINDGKLIANQVKWSLANIRYQNSLKKDSLQLDKVALNIQQVVTPLQHFATNKMQVVGMDLKTGNLRYTPGKGLYKMALEELKYLQDKNEAEISKFQLIPKLSKRQFSDQVKRTIARAEIKLPTGLVRGVSMKDILDGRFVCKSVDLQQLRVDLYKDQNIPLRESDLKKMPQVLLRQINLGLNVPLINVKESYLRFEGIGKDATKAGVLWFEHINGKVLNASNMYPNRALELHLSTSFMGEGKMSSVMKFPMNSGRNPYFAEFDVGPMPLARFNVFFAEFAAVKVDEGKLKSMHITFTGDTALTTTNMTFIYSGLKILMVQREGKKTKELLTVAANAVLMESNPSRRNGLRKSEVETEFQSNLFVIGNWMRGFTVAALETMSPSMAKIFGKRLKRKK